MKFDQKTENELVFDFVKEALDKVKYELLSIVSECEDFDFSIGLLTLLLNLFSEDDHFRKLWFIVLFNTSLLNYPRDKDCCNNELWKEKLANIQEVDNKFNDMMIGAIRSHYLEAICLQNL